MSKIIFNKKCIPLENPCIRHNDRGFTLGHGLFETILVKNNTMPALDYHWRRLKTSAPMLDITLPFDCLELETMIGELIVENNLQERIAGARVTVTHGESERGIFPLQNPTPNFLINVFECPTPTDKPFSALIVNTRKNEHSLSAKIKSISYLDNILAKKEAIDQKYDEAILLNTASNIADGAISNIFMVKDNQIITPPISDGALPGVIRSILLEELNQNYSVIEKTITPSELMLADEIFLTNALMGVKSVSRLNNREFHLFPVATLVKDKLRKKKNYI